MRGFTLSMLHTDKDTNFTPRSISVEESPIFSIKMNMLRIGVIQSQESLKLALHMHSFLVQHCNSKVLYSKNETTEDHDHYEESKSNQSYSNNQSNADEPIRHELVDHFLSLSFVQNKNNIIVSNSTVKVTLGSVKFDIDRKCVEHALDIIPGQLESLSETSKRINKIGNSHIGSPRGSFKMEKGYESNQMPTLLRPVHQIKSGRARHNSLIRSYIEEKNISENSSYFNDHDHANEEETTTTNLSIRMHLDSIQGKLKIGPSTSVETVIAKVQSS